jgi:hypothetical protein
MDHLKGKLIVSTLEYKESVQIIDEPPDLAPELVSNTPKSALHEPESLPRRIYDKSNEADVIEYIRELRCKPDLKYVEK